MMGGLGLWEEKLTTFLFMVSSIMPLVVVWTVETFPWIAEFVLFKDAYSGFQATGNLLMGDQLLMCTHCVFG